MILLLCMYALSTFPLSKQLLQYSQPYFLMGLRMTVAGLILLFFCYMRKHQPIFKKIYIPWYIRIMVFALFIPYCLRYWALAQQSTPLTPIIYNAGPFFTYLCGILYGVENSNRMRIGSLLLGLCGLLLYQGVSLSTYLHAAYNITEIALIISVISFSYGWLCIRHMVVEMNEEPMQVHAITMLGGGILGLCASYWFEQAPYLIHPSTAVPLLASVILISNCLTHTLYATFLRTYSLTFLQYAGLLVPVCIQIMQSLWKGESLHTTSVAAVSCISCGFLMLYRQERMVAVAKIWHRAQREYPKEVMKNITTH